MSPTKDIVLVMLKKGWKVADANEFARLEDFWEDKEVIDAILESGFSLQTALDKEYYFRRILGSDLLKSLASK